MWFSHLIPCQPCCRGRLALIFSLEVLPVCSSVNLIILSEQPHKFNDWGRDYFPGWLLPRVWCFQLHSWALRDVAVNSPGYGRCVFSKTPTHTMESWGGIPGLFPLPCLLTHTGQLPHSTLDFPGSLFSPHSMKGMWTSRTAFGIRHCSAWVVGTKILHLTNLVNTKDNLWSALIILDLFFTVPFTISKIKSSQSNTISNQSNKLSNNNNNNNLLLDGSILLCPDWPGGMRQLLVPQLSLTTWKLPIRLWFKDELFRSAPQAELAKFWVMSYCNGFGFWDWFFFSVGTFKLAEKVWGKGKEETDRNWVFLPDSLHCVFHRIIEWWRL